MCLLKTCVSFILNRPPFCARTTWTCPITRSGRAWSWRWCLRGSSCRSAPFLSPRWVTAQEKEASPAGWLLLHACCSWQIFSMLHGEGTSFLTGRDSRERSSVGNPSKFSGTLSEMEVSDNVSHFCYNTLTHRSTTEEFHIVSWTP